MASAGRVLIIPRGEWNAETQYEMLDLVYQRGTSWLAKKSVVGLDPYYDDDGIFWMKICEGSDLSEVKARIQALEEQMVGAISLDDIDMSEYALKSDLSGYASKSDLTNYATKTELNGTNTNVSGLGVRLNTVEPKVTNLVSDVNVLKSVANNLPTSFAKVKVLSYTGTGKYGKSNPCSVTCSDFVPKILLYLGYHHNFEQLTIMQESATSFGYYYTRNAIFCDHLTTNWQSSMGFIELSSGEPITRYAKKSADGKTIYWCVSDGNDGGIKGDDTKQLNANVRTYYILALG